MKLKLSRREIILIAGFWLVGCALLGVVFYFAVFQASPPSPDNIIVPQATYTLAHTQVTAKNLQPRTVDSLARWQDDAQPFAVTATWEKTDLDQVGQPTAWTYRFYSPGQKRFFFITVNPDGQVTTTSHGERIYNPPHLIPAEDWVVDSSEALNLWINHGGAAMLAAMPGLQVVAQLQVNNPDDPLTWTVAGYDRVSKHYHTTFIDAKTGKVTNIVSSLYQRR